MCERRQCKGSVRGFSFVYDGCRVGLASSGYVREGKKLEELVL